MRIKKYIENIKCITADMHTHSEHSHDSISTIDDMAKSAIGRGLKRFAVTDHCDIEYYETVDVKGVARSSFEDAMRANCEIEGIEILAGIEIGEAIWNNRLAREIIAEIPFDAVIGSVHAVRFDSYTKPYSLINFTEMGKETAKEYLTQYFEDMLCMVENTDFDILAHLTCPFRYINGKFGLGIGCRDYRGQIERILKLIIEKKIALEINTSCVGSAYDEFLPEEWIIELYRDLGGHLITVGSDAHIADNSALGFGRLYKTLKGIGFEKIYYYKERKPIGEEL